MLTKMLEAGRKGKNGTYGKKHPLSPAFTVEAYSPSDSKAVLIADM